MINKKEFDLMIEEMDSYDASREELIKKSRDVLKQSKELIYALHRNEDKDGKKLQQLKEELDKIACKKPTLIFEGAYSVAVQEFVEAMTYLAFIQTKELPTRKQLAVQTEDYLMGLCDLTGELGRRAVRMATQKKKAEVKRIRYLIDELEGQFIRFDFRNGNLRKKYDAVKWNLKKVEEVLYELS